MRLYLSGPMSNLPDLNFPAFHAAAADLRAAGYEVASPAELPPDPDKTWEDWLRDDLHLMLDCGGVAKLPGWHYSRGAQLEVHVADSLRMPTISVAVWISYKDRVDDLVHQLIG